MKFTNKNGEIRSIYGIIILIIFLICWKYYFANFKKLTHQIIIGIVIIACLNDFYKEFSYWSDVRDKTPNTKVDRELMTFLKYGKYFF